MAVIKLSHRGKQLSFPILNLIGRLSLFLARINGPGFAVVQNDAVTHCFSFKPLN